MILTPPKRLFDASLMKTILYEDVVDDVKEHGYVAISHVWGDQKKYKPEELGINGGADWKIPLSNCEKMIQMRNAMEYHSKKYCWFDILCMPQGEHNQGEVNKEIPFMGDYYAGADMTFVLSNNVHIISDSFHTWSNVVRDVMESGREFTDKEVKWMRERSVSAPKFHEDEWFERVWTLQEAVLSKKMIMVSKDGSHVNFSNIIARAGYLFGKDATSFAHVFDNESRMLSGMDTVVSKHKSKTLDLMGALGGTVFRKCYREHDRFYGVLGMLGYNDITVSYDIDMDLLNRNIIQHAHSKGDISWLAVGGNIRTGFIQPIYNPFPYVGLSWKENEGNICDIFFDNNVLALNSMLFGNVANSRKYDGNGEMEDFITWLSLTFAEWGFSDEDIFVAVIGYVPSYDTYNHIGANLIRGIRGGIGLDTALLECLMSLDEYGHKQLIDISTKIGQLTRQARTFTAVNAIISLLDTNLPLIISGDADIGDKVMLINLHDEVKRNLGLVSSESVRKGVCLLPQVKMSADKRNAFFSVREFVL